MTLSMWFKKAINGIAITESLANRVVKDYTPIIFDLPNEDLIVVSEDEEEPKKE